ncbi:hypothetical protein TWF481_010903 [Arthrobotrys musiformis]|uniref:Uncharacterized protein n=1 Tax=Arthrobotrys musiformis TaxID=47236 RepID=A0AAV9VXV1_9PEZI
MVRQLSTAQTLGFLQTFASLASGFVIGIYDKAKEQSQPTGRLAPSWFLCHPKQGARWGIYAVDISGSCREEDGDAATQWTFQIPGDRHLDPGEEISRFYLTGTDSQPVLDKSTGAKKPRPVITYDSSIQNTFFSYGYNEGNFVDAPFTLVRNGKNLALSDSVAAKNADLLDFVGIGGTKDDQRVLRLQNFGGVGSYWHIGRGAALPVTKTTPIVEFRIIADPRKNKPSTFEEQKNDKEGINLDYIDKDEYKVYEQMFPEQGKFSMFGNVGRGILGKVTGGIGKAGGKVAGGIKSYFTKPKDVEEKITVEDDEIIDIDGGSFQPGPTFERFEVESVQKDKKGN